MCFTLDEYNLIYFMMVGVQTIFFNVLFPKTAFIYTQFIQLIISHFFLQEKCKVITGRICMTIIMCGVVDLTMSNEY